jgi:hypothetical protein
MTTDLRAIVGAEAGAIADHVRHGLQSEKTPHYRACSDRLLRLRCQRLVDAFIEATGGDPEPFVAYVRAIASRRMAERVGLDELQRALTLLEGRAWTTVTERAAIGDLLDDLLLVTRTIGLAKDELAQRYLAGTRQAADRVSELEVPALFAGTDAIPETDPPAR